MRDESSQIVRLSTRDVAPADSLSYASWILDAALAPFPLQPGDPGNNRERQVRWSLNRPADHRTGARLSGGVYVRDKSK